ncbi:MAG: hypothetical protein N3G19_01725 [Candidatus Pacearchaeota archaeon]|nr:hypothetical protein [Candidatus Pacearchaeota archaeon]
MLEEIAPKPDLKKKIIQKIYNDTIEDYDQNRVWTALKKTGINPPNRLIKKLFYHYLSEWNPEEKIEKLKNLFGLPEIDFSELVDKCSFDKLRKIASIYNLSDDKFKNELEKGVNEFIIEWLKGKKEYSFLPFENYEEAFNKKFFKKIRCCTSLEGILTEKKELLNLNNILSNCSENNLEQILDKNIEIAHVINNAPLLTEFLLYGFITASGKTFKEWRGSYYLQEKLKDFDYNGCKGFFCTNNGVIALADYDGTIYIRPNDSWHGCWDDKEAGAIEKILLELGYKNYDIFVPHSNGEVFEEKEIENLFRLMAYVSKEVRAKRGQTGCFVIDLSEPIPHSYDSRSIVLPTIRFEELGFIPGNPYIELEIIKRKKSNFLKALPNF